MRLQCIRHMVDHAYRLKSEGVNYSIANAPETREYICAKIVSLYKAIIPFYIVCFGLYIFFTRQPDYLDGEFTPGTIHFIKDSSSQNFVPKATFILDSTSYAVDAKYAFRNLKEGKKVPVIFEASNPQKAAVYSWWGYWIKWDELIASILIPVIFLIVANAITSNPTPEALIEQIETDKPVKRRRYD